MEHNKDLIEISDLLLCSANKHLLRKAVFSKPLDNTLIKTVLSEKIIGKQPVLQAEFFHKDNKVTHKNFPLSQLNDEMLLELSSQYMQINLICTFADCEYKCSSSGKTVIINHKKFKALLEKSDASAISTGVGNNRKKNHILTGNEPFLKLLGVSDENGRIYDKKQSKFKQINRFLEIIRDCEDVLPKDKIRICDLCCGKSYLSFAAYHYFSNIKGMPVSMTGVDLKPDVVEHCSAVARALGFDGLEFICQDINLYKTEEYPELVISLHACDIATDMVLQKAAAWKSDVILSTPCCHHELNHSINCEALSFITEHSMLRQKLCDAATDALRLARLEAIGYSVSAIELIDPEKTPKNVMLRAIKIKGFDKNSKQAVLAQKKYMAAKEFLCADSDTSKLHF